MYLPIFVIEPFDHNDPKTLFVSKKLILSDVPIFVSDYHIEMDPKDQKIRVYLLMKPIAKTMLRNLAKRDNGAWIYLQKLSEMIFLREVKPEHITKCKRDGLEKYIQIEIPLERSIVGRV